MGWFVFESQSIVETNDDPRQSGQNILQINCYRTEDVALDGSGNVYTAGLFAGTADFDPGAGAFNLASAGFNDIFVSKLDNAGNFVWAKQMGGPSNDQAFGVALDASGNVYTAGNFEATADFDPGASAFNLTSAGFKDIFVSRLDSAGNFVWAKQMGGPGVDRVLGVALDGSGNVYTAGVFRGTADFDPGAGVFNLTSAGEQDIFVSKLDSAGNFVWAKQMGGTGFDEARAVAVDGSGDVYTAGFFFGTADFDPGVGAFNLTSAGSADIFVSKLDSAGNFVLAVRMGGPSPENDRALGVAVDANGSVLTTGLFFGTADFDPGAGTFNLSSAGSADIFVSKLATANALDLLDWLIMDVEAADLVKHTENGLTKKLQNAKRFLLRGMTSAAIHQISSFKKKVMAQSGKTIHPADAAAFIEKADLILAVL